MVESLYTQFIYYENSVLYVLSCINRGLQVVSVSCTFGLDSSVSKTIFTVTHYFGTQTPLFYFFLLVLGPQNCRFHSNIKCALDL